VKASDVLTPADNELSLMTNSNLYFIAHFRSFLYVSGGSVLHRSQTAPYARPPSLAAGPITGPSELLKLT